MEGDKKGKRQRPEDAAPVSPGDREGEEEQVEEFFALLKSIREMREQAERRRRAGNSVAGKRPKAGGAAWTPTFEWEDFAVASQNGKAGVPAAASREGESRGKEKKEEEGTSLDLRLSL